MIGCGGSVGDEASPAALGDAAPASAAAANVAPPLSWGSDKDGEGRPIDADATDLALPENATDADVAVVAHTCNQLDSLSICSGCEITDAGLCHLANLQQLQTLNLGGCTQVTGAGLSGLHQLSSLDLSECVHITDEDLRHLATGLQQLQTLLLGGCSQITDSGLQHIANLQELRTLDLSFCTHITDSGLEHIAGLKQLSTLYLNGLNRLTDAGLAHLSGLEHLSTVQHPLAQGTSGTAVTNAGSAAFAAAQQTAEEIDSSQADAGKNTGRNVVGRSGSDVF